MTMPDFPTPSTPFRRSFEPSWFDVVELMDYLARSERDGLLYFFARLMDDLVDNHYNGDQGCEECQGGEAAESCTRWLEGQSYMLGWLMDRAVR